MYIIRLITIYLILSSSCTFAATANDKVEKKLPAAWVWKMTSSERVIYLVGELHLFLGVRDADVDFQQGFDVYDLASEVFIEPEMKARPNKDNQKLSGKLNPDTWVKIDNTLMSLLNETKNSAERKEILRKKGLDELDGQSAAMAYFNMHNFSYFMYVNSLKTPPLIAQGLTSKLLKIDNPKGINKKNRHLEDEFAADDVWNENCNTKELSQTYIESALLYFEMDKFWNSGKIEKLQNAFWSKDHLSDEVLNIWLDNYPGSKLMLQCNIIPRTAVWVQKILEMTKTKGPPVAIFAGFAHVVGPHGLLEIFKSNGFTEVK